MPFFMSWLEYSYFSAGLSLKYLLPFSNYGEEHALLSHPPTYIFTVFHRSSTCQNIF